MLTYGIERLRFFRDNNPGIDIPGAISFQEDSTSAVVDKIYSDGELVSLTTGECKRFSGKLTTYTEPLLGDVPTTATYCFTKHGKRAMSVLLNADMVPGDVASPTLQQSIVPATFETNVYPIPMYIQGRLVSHMSVEERLVGRRNFDALFESLYGQNGSVSTFLDVLNNGLLETRRFRVLYNSHGVWEISGPDHLIRNHTSGEWEIDDINYISLDKDEFVLIDDYEEDPVWLP